ncbi:MAG TPA: hypothetical protein VNQ77_19505 [Frankiaceae bacterium]|nr:hypothetical protein [Frankiaceae bacterium]
MRLALGLALAAAAIVPATASAAPDVCTPPVATAYVCVPLPECFRPTQCAFDDDAAIYGECTPMQPVSGPCATIDSIHVPLSPR